MGETESESEPLMGRNILSLTLFGTALHGNNKKQTDFFFVGFNIICKFSTTATAKLLQSCPTLCDSINGSPPGSLVPGVLQARTLEWVAISFSNTSKWKVKMKLLICNPRDCSLQGSSVHGIFQARVLEWGAIAFSDKCWKVSKYNCGFVYFSFLLSVFNSCNLKLCYYTFLMNWPFYYYETSLFIPGLEDRPNSFF